MKSMQFVQRSSHGHGHDHESLVHQPKEDPFAKDECTLYCQNHVKCCGRDYKHWLLWIIGLATSAVVFGVLFVVFVSLYGASEDSNTQCRLTYTDGGVITEQEMMDWSKHNAWPLRHPKWNDHLKTCTCNSKAYDPTALSNTDEVDVWLAPGDMVDLSRFGIHLPIGFATKYSGAFAREDHVKVCLRYGFLVDLWGNQTVGHHCHNATQTDASNPLQTQPFIAYDGALFCHGASARPLQTLLDGITSDIPGSGADLIEHFVSICPYRSDSTALPHVQERYNPQSSKPAVFFCEKFYEYNGNVGIADNYGKPYETSTVVDPIRVSEVAERSTGTQRYSFINTLQAQFYFQTLYSGETAETLQKIVDNGYESTSFGFVDNGETQQIWQTAGILVEGRSIEQCLKEHPNPHEIDVYYRLYTGDWKKKIPCISILVTEPFVFPLMKTACGDDIFKPMLTDRWFDIMYNIPNPARCLPCTTEDPSNCPTQELETAPVGKLESSRIELQSMPQNLMVEYIFVDTSDDFKEPRFTLYYMSTTNVGT